MCCVQTKPPSPPCYANRSNEKIGGEKKEEDVGFHQRLADVFRNFLSFKSSPERGRRPKRRTERCHAGAGTARGNDFFPFPFPWLLCATHNLAAAPAVAPRQCICRPFVLQKSTRFPGRGQVRMGRGRGDGRGGHLLVFLQSQEQLFTFRFNQELQRCRVTLKRQQTGEGVRRIGSGRVLRQRFLIEEKVALGGVQVSRH